MTETDNPGTAGSSESLALFKHGGGLGCVIGARNGPAGAGCMLSVVNARTREIENYALLYIYVERGKVYDKINGYEGVDVAEYMSMLKELNSEPRLDPSLKIGTFLTGGPGDLILMDLVR